MTEAAEETFVFFAVFPAQLYKCLRIEGVAAGNPGLCEQTHVAVVLGGELPEGFRNGIYEGHIAAHGVAGHHQRDGYID